MRQASAEPLELHMKQVCTSDYKEYIIQKPSTREVVFKGVKCYRFWNLQNMVRKVEKKAGVWVRKEAVGHMVERAQMQRNGEKGYDYIEVMACPGGCMNRGGQVGLEGVENSVLMNTTTMTSMNTSYPHMSPLMLT